MPTSPLPKSSLPDLARHPHLRRIEVNTPNGVVSYPAPAVIFVDEPRPIWSGAGDRRASASPQEIFRTDQSLMSEKPDLDHLRHGSAAAPKPPTSSPRNWSRDCGRRCLLPRRRPRTGDAAPFTVHWCLAPPVVAASELGPDGHPARGEFLPPVPLPRRMWAGGELEFFDTLARWRRGDADLAHQGCELEVRVDRHAVLCLCRP